MKPKKSDEKKVYHFKLNRLNRLSLLKKKKTFFDWTSVSQKTISKRYTKPVVAFHSHMFYANKVFLFSLKEKKNFFCLFLKKTYFL